MNPDHIPEQREFTKTVVLRKGGVEPSLDSRMAGIGTREVSSLYYQTLKSRAKAAEIKIHGRNIGRAQRLMRLLEMDREELSKMRGSASKYVEDGYMSQESYEHRFRYIEESPRQKEVKSILLELGLAEMLLLGDWKVNREGGERAPVRYPMPADGERRREILAEAEALSRELRIGDRNVIAARAVHLGELMNLTPASAVQVVLRELKQVRTRSVGRAGVSETCDLAVAASASDNIASSMGIVPFNEIESLILQFHHENGLLASTAPISEGKLVALDVGCGNGVTGDRLRRDSTDPFNNGRRLVNYWSEIGFADRIYWTLSDLLYSLLRDEHKNDPAILEFVEVVSILLVRKINYLKRYPLQGLSKEDNTLLELPGNPNIIRLILPNLERYIKNFSNLKRIKADREFASDSEHVLSEDCRAVIQDFFEGTALFKAMDDSTTGSRKRLSDGIFSPSEFGKKLGTRAFLQTYFCDEAIEHSDKLEKQIHAKQEEIQLVEARISEIALEIRSLIKKQLAANERLRIEDLNEENRAKIALLIDERRVLKEKVRELNRSKEALEAYRSNLSGRITIYPHNIILGDFAQFKDIMLDAPTFDWGRSWRATSHADDNQYAEIVYECAHRLKPGGIITEDGNRESYTRFERIEQLQDLQQKLGGEYRVSLIAKQKGPAGVLIERAVVRRDGEIVFFSDQKGQQILRDDAQLVPVDMFAARWPEMAVRNKIIEKLKGLFIDSVLQNCPPEEVPRRTYHGRMQFSDLHRIVDAHLDSKVFGTDEWRDLGHPEFELVVEAAWGTISVQIEKVRRRIKAVTHGAALLRGEKAVVRTFSPKYVSDDGENRKIAERRACKVELLPRNLDVPDLSDTKLENERESLLAALTEIAKLTGRPPLRLHLYNCFTDAAMEDAIFTLLGESDLLEAVKVKVGGSHYPEQQIGVIDIFGGSANDAYDEGGRNYIDRFVLPWLEQVDCGASVRGLGICFGSQCVLEGLGKVKGFDVKTQRGALQFGPFPVVFDGRHVAIKYLAEKSCTGVFTRSGYSIPEDSAASWRHLRPLAYEGRMDDYGVWSPDMGLPPVAYSLLNGRVITSQFHPEVSLRDPAHLKHLMRFTGRHAEALSRAFAGQGAFLEPNPLASPNYLMRNHFDLRAENISGGNTNWVARDIGMAFLIPSLLHLANGLLVELKKARR